MCLEGRALGVYQNGGYATHVLAMEPRHLIDPGTVDPAVAATLRLQRHHGVFRDQEGDADAAGPAIVLVGAGGLGLNAIAVLKAMGHRNIVSVDLSEAKRAAATAAGAHDGDRRQRRGRGATDRGRVRRAGAGR